MTDQAIVVITVILFLALLSMLCAEDGPANLGLGPFNFVVSFTGQVHSLRYVLLGWIEYNMIMLCVVCSIAAVCS